MTTPASAYEERLLRLYRAAEHLLRDPNRAAEWLVTPIDRLGGAIPLQAIRSEEATKSVEDLVFRLMHGVY